jgi:hypothetical protein
MKLQPTKKPTLSITEAIGKLTPEELKDPNNILTLYTLFGLDEILLSADPKGVPERVWDALKDIMKELDRIPKPNLKSAAIKLHAAVDSVECALGPRDGEDGAALMRLRRFEDQIAARRKS